MKGEQIRHHLTLKEIRTAIKRQKAIGYDFQLEIMLIQPATRRPESHGCDNYYMGGLL
jgi:hypothetical protein